MKKIALIGSTGSIGKQVLSVVRNNADKFKIVSLAAGNNISLLTEQIKEFKPLVATSAVEFDKDFTAQNPHVEFSSGENAFINAIISEADVVVVALVGFNGLSAVLSAIEKGKNIALANKESLVVGGGIVMKLAEQKGVKISPIDSEHSAVWQALSFDFNKPFNKIILTCSGGAFRDYDEEQLSFATKEDALRHPNWNMGDKITVDCATLVNKGFEVIEAHWLYNASFDKIKVIIHKESVIHSMVEYADSSVIAQMSYPSMEIPISLALSYPDRLPTSVNSLDFAKIKNLSFSEVDDKRFPCFKLVVGAGETGGGYPAVINGANEAAVRAFLCGKIRYKDIYPLLSDALNAFGGKGETVEDLNVANAFGESFVKTAISKKYGE